MSEKKRKKRNDFFWLYFSHPPTFMMPRRAANTKRGSDVVHRNSQRREQWEVLLRTKQCCPALSHGNCAVVRKQREATMVEVRTSQTLFVSMWLQGERPVHLRRSVSKNSRSREGAPSNKLTFSEHANLSIASKKRKLPSQTIHPLLSINGPPSTL